MGQKATVYDKPPTFDDGSDTFSSYVKKPKGGWASTDKFTVREILYAKSGMASKAKIPGQTIHGVFSGCAERAGDKPALRWEDPKETAIRDDGSVPDPTGRETWNSFTWKEYYDCCRTAAQAFIALGMEPMDGVTIFGFNSRQWFVSEVAAIFAGGVAAMLDRALAAVLLALLFEISRSLWPGILAHALYTMLLSSLYLYQG